jgi:poly-gamma-glutamate synthesis protein (capsule biosynthesis protein)
LELLSGADYRIFNLETPLTDTYSPIEKFGPTLIAPTCTVEGYKAIGTDLLTLANNHIMDQGHQGLKSTLSTLEKNGISYVGAGENIQEASRSFIINKNGEKIGVYACAEHEFSIADENAAGANPFDPLESVDHIAKLKSECDYVIVLYHGGREHFRYPSPRLQKVCRKICEKGADLVVCQHSHCVGCEEKHGDSTIVYGQGNFLFDHSKSEFWQTSLLIELDTVAKSIRYVPLRKADFAVCMADDGEDIISQFTLRSEEIRKDGFIKEKYSQLAKEARNNYILNISGSKWLFRALNRLCGYRLKCKISAKRKMAIKNYLMCEVHNELFCKALDQE